MKVIIENNILKVKVSSSKKSITDGMMGKRFDESFDGMLFFMPELDNQSFWMFNCIIPLDIIFINGTTITEVHSNCQPCNNKKNCESYQGFGDKVLEVSGGFCEEQGIKKGDDVSFSLF